MLSRMGLPNSSSPGVPIPQKIETPAVKETPRAAPKAKPIGKAQPFLGAPAPISSTGAPRRNPLSLFNPYPSLSFPPGPAPAAPSAPPAAPQVTLALPPAPSTVKAIPLGPGGSKLPTHEYDGSSWGLGPSPSGPTRVPHALIQTVDKFKVEFLAAFGNPDATRAAERKITSLTQTSTCAKYITKFCTLQMELNWNNAALHGQFARGLHWEVCRQIATRERQPKEPATRSRVISLANLQPPPTRGKYSQQATKTGPLSSNPNYVLEEERNRRCAEGLCIKCSKPGHKFAECWTGWKATRKEDKGKAKEAAKIGKDSEYQLGKE
ncbi:Retrotransposon gag protein [Rhizoctonia solani]|uniref:Retrotransposon gag protein n=1 Tax=Rhizoctonia solani TaxID=456999 RepID=A0A8H7IKA1_9AGAM|nr:Retrotransposon gag protein [Rhizoctonia solani]